MKSPAAIVAGSGIDLSHVLDSIVEVIPFRAADAIPQGAVAGHEYAFLRGMSGARPVIVQCGRRHCYEGIKAPGAAATVDALAQMGVDTIVFTNAAGGLQPEMKPGDLMAVAQVRPFLPPQGSPWWPEAPATIAPDFDLPGCDHAGAYAWVLGPNYETRAEIAALHAVGAAAVGMSTGPEMARCRERGIRCAAVSCITNNCCTPMVLTHEHVVEMSRGASDRLTALLRRWLAEML